MRKKLSKLIVLALSFALVLTSLPFNVMTANATTALKTGAFSDGSTLKDSNNKNYEYPSTETGFMQIYYISYASQEVKKGECLELAPLKRYKVNEKVAYCLEHGVVVNANTPLKAKNLDKSFIEDIYKNSGRDYVLNNMNLALYYGRQEGASISNLLDSPENGGLGFRDWKKKQKGTTFYGTTYKLDDWEAATRQLIHESQQQFRDNKFNLKSV